MVKEKLSFFRQVPSYAFLGLFTASLIVSISSLRHNNQTMIKLRDQVYATDKNDGDVNGALNNLRSYVYSHMNTNLAGGGNSIKPPIQLKYTYQRLQAQAEAQRQSGQAPTPIPASLYKFDFISPSWSPDFAGWSLVVTALLLLAFVIRFLQDWVANARVKP